MGSVGATIDDETVTLSSGECAVVPEMAPHSLRNGGQSVAHVVGLSPDNALTATFDETLMPFVAPVSLKLENERDERVSAFSRTLSYLDQGANPTQVGRTSPRYGYTSI